MTTGVVSVATKAPGQNNLPKDEYHSVKKRRLPMSKSQNRDSESREIPVKEVSEFSVSGDKLLHQRIAEKAYELYECRGCCHGQDLDDWLEAERLVLAEIEPQTDKAAGNPQSEPERRKKH
jgi:Protein of unknown function (DUF2934)